MAAIRRPTPAVEGLRNTRRSMGDGTLAGRSRIATPHRTEDTAGRLRQGADAATQEPPGDGGEGGGFPSTITVELADEEIASDEWVPLLWELPLRDNLMTVDGTLIDLPVEGTWHPTSFKLDWTNVGFDSTWKGEGVRVRVKIDGVPVWPVATEQAVTPDRGLPVPSVEVESFPTFPAGPGKLSIEVRQPSGEAQFIEQARLTVALRETPSDAGGIVTRTYSEFIAEFGPHVWLRLDGDNEPLDFRVPDGTSRSYQTGQIEDSGVAVYDGKTAARFNPSSNSDATRINVSRHGWWECRTFAGWIRGRETVVEPEGFFDQPRGLFQQVGTNFRLGWVGPVLAGSSPPVTQEAAIGLWLDDDTGGSSSNLLELYATEFGGTPVAPETWYYVVATWDSGTTRLFIDGIKAAEGEGRGDVSTNPSSTVFTGAQHTPSFATPTIPLAGDIAEVLILVPTLTDAEVAQLTQAAFREANLENL